MSAAGKEENEIQDCNNFTECRACLQKCNSELNLYSIFQVWDPPLDGMEGTIADNLVKLANIQITNCDQHSKLICQTCYNKLQKACSFISSVKRNDFILRQRAFENELWPKPIQLVKSVNSLLYKNPLDVEIKQEVLSDTEDMVTDVIYKQDMANVEVKIEPEEIQSQPIQITVNGTIPIEQYKDYTCQNGLVETKIDIHQQMDHETIINQQLDYPLKINQLLQAPLDGNLKLHNQIETKDLAHQTKNKDMDTDINLNLEQTTAKKPVAPGMEIKVTNGQEDFKPEVKVEPDIENNILDTRVKDEPSSEDENSVASELSPECILCMKTFKSVTGLKAHVISQHNYKTVRRKNSNYPSPVKVKKEKYVCATCRRCFTTSTDLMVHETCHNKTVCYGCSEKFDTFQQLSIHRRRCKAVNSKEKRRPKTLDDVRRLNTSNELAPDLNSISDDIKDNISN